MISVSGTYIEVLKRRDFLVLTLMVFFGQMASALLILSLIVSVFSQTGSTFGVSGVVLSFTIPAFFLMVFAGLAADIFDRKKIMIVAYTATSLVVLFILITGQAVAASIPLSFLYFAGNTFFIPSSSAATAQVVKREQLLAANSIFVFTLSTALLTGFFLASVIHFFFGSPVTLSICLVLLLLSIILGLTLPQLEPTRQNHPTLVKKLKNILSGFKFVMKSKTVWYFFSIFVLIQGLVFFAITLAPEFFSEIVGIPIDKSPILVMPLVGLGVVIGSIFVHRPELSEGLLISIGLSIVGMVAVLLGLALMLDLIIGSLLLVYIVFGLIFLGFGAVIIMVAARTVIQKKVPHSNLGIVFAASMIATSFLSAVLSPLAALLEATIGFVNIFVYGGLLLLAISATYAYLGNRWKF